MLDVRAKFLNTPSILACRKKQEWVGSVDLWLCWLFILWAEVWLDRWIGVHYTEYSCSCQIVPFIAEY